MEMMKSDTLGKAVGQKYILSILAFPWFMDGVRTASRISQDHCKDCSLNTYAVMKISKKQNKIMKVSILPPSLCSLNNVMRSNEKKTEYRIASLETIVGISSTEGCRNSVGKAVCNSVIKD